MDNIEDKQDNLYEPQQPDNQEDSLDPQINEQASPPISPEPDNQAPIQSPVEELRQPAGEQPLEPPAEQTVEQSPEPNREPEPVKRPDRPRIPVIPDEHLDDFDEAQYLPKKGKGYGKWFIALCLLGVLVWMIPGSFDTEEIVVQKESGFVKVPGVKREIQLYLTDKSQMGLIQTGVTIDLGGTTEQKIHSVLEALFAENQRIRGPFPQEIIVRDIFMHGEEAIISLDGAFKKKFMGGGWSELLAVYSLVNTICDNFELVNTVRILINDQETEFFVSHISLAGSLKPSSSLLLLDETPDL